MKSCIKLFLHMCKICDPDVGKTKTKIYDVDVRTMASQAKLADTRSCGHVFAQIGP